MGARLRRTVAATVVIAFLTVASPASAEDFSACWVTTRTNPVTLTVDQVTRCRIAGGDTVDYTDSDAIPVRLYPNIGSDLEGECWYMTSTETNYQLVRVTLGGGAEIFLVVDDEASTIGGVYRQCTSEPGVAVDPSVEAWEYVSSFVHPPPTPEVNPSPGDGVTGLETFVSVPVPPVHQAQLASASGATLDIEIEVSGVEVDWGDSRVDTFPADQEMLAGYPDGGARHIYELKDEVGYDLGISFAWTARWRVAGGDWEYLDVPNTTTSIVYPVAEIVTRLTD